MHLALAFRAFFAVLFGKAVAQRVREALNAAAPPSVPQKSGHEEKPVVVSAASPARSDALTLLMVLQRDARLLDLLNESLEGYSDAEIGGAARPVLLNAGKSLERMFGIQPLATQAEGERVEIPAKASPIRWRLAGNTSAAAGRVAHPGWLATKVDLPKWTGQRDDAMVLAPIEVDAGS